MSLKEHYWTLVIRVLPEVSGVNINFTIRLTNIIMIDLNESTDYIKKPLHHKISSSSPSQNSPIRVSNWPARRRQGRRPMSDHQRGSTSQYRLVQERHSPAVRAWDYDQIQWRIHEFTQHCNAIYRTRGELLLCCVQCGGVRLACVIPTRQR